MIPRLLAGLVLPIAGSTAILRFALPHLWGASRTLILSLAVVIALGASSLLFASSIFVFGPEWSLYVPCEVALWIAVLAVSLRAARGRQVMHRARRPLTRRELVVGLVFAAALAVSMIHFYWSTANFPSGAWDAQAIWALRARFLSRGFDGHWRDGFQAVLGWSLPDYPLMLPSNTARLWLYAQTESLLVPVVLAALFKYATVGMVVGALFAARQRQEGLCAGGVLLASFGFNLWGAGQVADVSLGAFVLASTILLSWIVDPDRRPSPGNAAAILAFCAGCAAWTKNEGLVFAAAVLASLTVALVWRRQLTLRTAILVMGGLVVPFAILFYFKTNIAPPNYLLASSPANRLLDPDRHTYIAVSFARQLWSWNTSKPIGVIPFVIAYALATSAVRGIRPSQLLTAMPLVAMLFGYYASYVVTPLDLKWQIDSSLARLIVQIWPAIVYVCFTLAAPYGMPNGPLISKWQIQSDPT